MYAGRDTVFSPQRHECRHRKSLIVAEVLFRGNYQNFPRKIALMTSFWMSMMCTISAGIVGVFE